MMRFEATFQVLVRPAHDVPGQWVAHCLNIDVMSQGDSIAHAFEMAREAVLMAVVDDLAHDRDPRTRPPAPQEAWDCYEQIQRSGAPLESIDPSRVTAAGAQLYACATQLPAGVGDATPSAELEPSRWRTAVQRNGSSAAPPPC